MNLTDIYSVIAYYLGHQDPIEKYLDEQKKEAQTVRKMVETRCESFGLRDRLLARRV